MAKQIESDLLHRSVPSVVHQQKNRLEDNATRQYIFKMASYIPAIRDCALNLVSRLEQLPQILFTVLFSFGLGSNKLYPLIIYRSMPWLYNCIHPDP